MRHYRNLKDANIHQSWVTIGIFDGVHIGHQVIIKDMVSHAHDTGISTGVVTFFPHPVEILQGLNEPLYITSPELRAELIGQLGVDFVLTMNFTRRLSNTTAENFFLTLNKHLGIKGLWAGNDFALGKNRTGTIDSLKSIGSKMGFFVKESQKIALGGTPVSSSLIRNYIREGMINEANQLLGRNFSLQGEIITGNKRGKLLGIPTANLNIWNKQILPLTGVYATIAVHNQKRYKSVTNVGVKPTFQDGTAAPVVETHIFNFSEDIYGQSLSLEFISCLRKETQFNSPEALVEQIHKDIQQADEVLHNVT